MKATVNFYDKEELSKFKFFCWDCFSNTNKTKHGKCNRCGSENIEELI